MAGHMWAASSLAVGSYEVAMVPTQSMRRKGVSAEAGGEEA